MYTILFIIIIKVVIFIFNTFLEIERLYKLYFLVYFYLLRISFFFFKKSLDTNEIS